MSNDLLPPGFSRPLWIGGGGFASVYRARQDALERFVAVKIIKEKDKEKRTGLLKEARIQAELNIECIPSIYNIYEEKSRIYMIMEWIDGIDLEGLSGEVKTGDRIKALVDGMVYSLSLLHSAGYAHRDIKPANIMISRSGRVYLLDFSFTRNTSIPSESVSGYIKGTPGFMAPELWAEGPDVDLYRADVFSLGTIIRGLIQNEDMPHLIKECTDYDPLNRPASAQEVLSRWRAYRGGLENDEKRKQVVEPIVLEKFARRLFAAAEKEYSSGKRETAYWHANECLERLPDYRPALSFLEKFSNDKEGFSKSVKFAAAAGVTALSVLIIVLTFVMELDRSGNAVVKDYLKEGRGRISLNSGQGASFGYVNRPDFRDVKYNSSELNGCLIVESYPDSGHLYIDGEEIELSYDTAEVFDLERGVHDLRWYSAGEKLLWKERVNILPFKKTGLVIRGD